MSIAVEFFINDFNTDIFLDISGQIDAYDASLDVTDCVADLYVDTNVLRETFKFQTDSDDVTDAVNTDIKYFTFRDNFWSTDVDHSFSINVADAVQNFSDTNVQIFNNPTTNKNMVSHDFVRYLAKSLFNAHQGVDLFNNEEALMNDIRLKSQKAWAIMDNALIKWDVKERDLTGVSLYDVTYSAQVAAAPNTYEYQSMNTNFRYYNDDPSTNTDDNICMSILKQLAFHQPGRFKNILNGTTNAVDVNGLYSIPFIAGDIISMKLTITPASDQHLLVGLSQPLDPRTYKIRFNLVDGHASGHGQETLRATDEVTTYRFFDTSTLNGVSPELNIV